MITQCPHCKTVFRISAAHMNIAEGHVRCGHCHHVFNAGNHLLPGEAPGAPAPRRKSRDLLEGPPPGHRPEPYYVEDSAPRRGSRGPLEGPPPGHRPESDYVDDLEVLLEAELIGPQRSWGGVLLWTVLGLVLAALLAAQYMWFMQRHWVLQNATLRPWLEKGCEMLPECKLPVTRDLNRIEVVKRLVDRAPETQQATLVHIIFKNGAPFPQPYPQLELRFTDSSGRLVGMRRFTPGEYLRDAQAETSLMPVDESVHVKLEFRDAVEAMYTYGFDITFL